MTVGDPLGAVLTLLAVAAVVLGLVLLGAALALRRAGASPRTRLSVLVGVGAVGLLLAAALI